MAKIAYGECTIINVEEPFSVILSNEAQSIPTDANRKVTKDFVCYTDIKVTQGMTPHTDFIIGNISSANGITVTKSSARITFTVKAGTTISADTGTFNIPITLGEDTVTKVFSWCCQKEGAAAKSVKVIAESTVFKSTDGGETFSPDIIRITPTFQGGITFSKWQYSIDSGTTWKDITNGKNGLTISSSTLIVSKTCDLYTNAITAISFKCFSNNSAYYDIITISKLGDSISKIRKIESTVDDLAGEIKSKVEETTIFEVTDENGKVKKTLKDILSSSTQDLYGFKREVKQQYNDLEIGGVNLFVQNTVIEGKYLSSENVEINDAAWGYSDYINVGDMDYYIASGFTNLGAAPATCFYNSDKVFLSGVKSEIQNSQESKRKMLQIPDSAAFMRFSFLLADIETLKIEKGTKSTSYSPSPEDVAHNIKTVEEQTATKFSWLVKSGTSESNFELTDRTISLISKNINLNGIVTFMNTAKGEVYKNLYAYTGYADFESIKSTDDAICYAKLDSNSVAIDSSTYWQGSNSLKISGTAKDRVRVYLGNKENNYGCIKVEQGKTYQITAYVKSDSEQNVSFGIDWITHGTKIDAATGTCYIESYLFNSQRPSIPKGCTTITPNTSWQRAITTFTVKDKTNSYYYISIVPTIYNQLSKNANFWIDGIMVEEVESLNSEPNEFTNSAKATIIDGNSILTDSITADKLTANSITAEKIMADALKSKNYVVGESGSFLNLADGSFDSKYLKWDNAGKVIANDITVVGGSINVNNKFIVNNDGIATLQGATVVGNITAESGKIGKFNLDNLALVTGDTDVTCAGLGGSSQAFWAGSLIMDNAPFRVGYDGKLYASDADISGVINSTDGSIGGWKINSEGIKSFYSHTDTVDTGILDFSNSLSLLSDTSSIILNYDGKTYSDSSRKNILERQVDSLSLNECLIQGSSKYTIYGEENEEQSYSFYLSAINGLQMWDNISGDNTVYSWNGILFNDGSRLNSAKCHAGLVAHYWNSNNTSCGTKKGNYVKLTSFSNGTEGKLSELYYKKSNYQIAISRNGVYSFQTRLAINSPTANKRVEVALFKNGSRYAAYSASYATPVDYTLGQLNNYILYLSEGDTIDFRIAPIDSYSVNVNMADILIYALDYDFDGTELL